MAGVATLVSCRGTLACMKLSMHRDRNRERKRAFGSIWLERGEVVGFTGRGMFRDNRDNFGLTDGIDGFLSNEERTIVVRITVKIRMIVCFTYLYSLPIL